MNQLPQHLRVEALAKNGKISLSDYYLPKIEIFKLVFHELSWMGIVIINSVPSFTVDMDCS